MLAFLFKGQRRRLEGTGEKTSKDREETMKVLSRVRVNARNKPLANGQYQTDIVPNAVLDMEDIAKGWAEQSAMRPGFAKSMVESLEGYILDELGKGNQLSFGLVSFYPRLSGNLEMRDSNPATEGLYVRGAVKARRKLMSGLKGGLVAVNAISSIRTVITGVYYEGASRHEPIKAGMEITVCGESISVVEGREDEGVWLEAKRRGKVAKGRIVESTPTALRVVFDELPAKGKYFLVVATRCGRDVSLKPVRCRAQVSV